jgi:outer membrane cobalamin receptor
VSRRGVVQTGGRGGATSLFVRGGASNFTKVLIDGVPANDIGGAFDFAISPRPASNASKCCAARTASSTAPMR